MFACLRLCANDRLHRRGMYFLVQAALRQRGSSATMLGAASRKKSCGKKALSVFFHSEELSRLLAIEEKQSSARSGSLH